MNKVELFSIGANLLRRFCAANSLPIPELRSTPGQEWPFDNVCAFYRPSYVAICIPRCASIGRAGPAWSFPGYTVDRTPYGVLQHELGHHVDILRSTRKGSYFGDFSIAVRGQTGDEAISSYCPNDAEWFAEMFRVFVTNPDLLLQMRPRTHRELRACFEPVFTDTWRERLKDAPARTIAAAERKIELVASKSDLPATEQQSLQFAGASGSTDYLVDPERRYRVTQ